jgi:cytochrome c2
MPATEETAYPIKRLHRIFAVTSLALLATTIWLLVADHRRPWKQYQRAANEIELRMTRLRKFQHETGEAIRARHRLQERLDAARQQGLDPALLTQIRQAVVAAAQRRGVAPELEQFDQRLAAWAAVADESESSQSRRQEANPQRQAAREAVLHAVDALIADAEFAEASQRDRRNAAASDLEVAKAGANLAVRTGRSRDEVARLQAVVDQAAQVLRAARVEHEQREAHLEQLRTLRDQLTREERELQKRLAASREELERLERLLIARRSTWFEFEDGVPKPGKKLLELPVLDAFNSPLRVHNLWAEGLTQDYHFREVPRYDRCTTCHTAIDKSLADQPGSLLYPLEQVLHFALKLQTPGSSGSGGTPTLPEERIEQAIGLRLGEGALVGDGQVSVVYVRPGSPAARAMPAASEPVAPAEAPPELAADAIYAGLLWPPEDPSASGAPGGLLLGDALLEIDGQRVEDHAWAFKRLLNACSAAKPDAGGDAPTMILTVRRGVPFPFTSHPRLDLFVGQSSPHTLSEFACTICHGGQGSATDFQWASHTPNTVPERAEWREQYAWFDNPHWGEPMLPRRFAESACLKCHHRVADLQPTERFPDPPAAKLMRGHQLILDYGCFGCHEINGFENGRSIGPDLRLEPLIQPLVTDPDVPASLDVLPDAQREDPPGRLRRPGPSLRHVDQKLTTDFLVDWIRNPQRFRPETRMPRGFGLWDHLAGDSLQIAQRFEPLEVTAMAAYLQKRSEPITFAADPADIAAAQPAEMVARGRQLFLTRGCLACHDHQQFPDAAQRRDRDQAVMGPDLSALADKLSGEAGRRWLVDFIRQPTRYDPRTMMPDSYLEPIEQQQPGQEVTRTDPAQDIAAFLLAVSSQGYTAPAVPEPPVDVLDDLVLEYISDGYHATRAEDFARRGIPARQSDAIREADRELLVPDADYDAPEFRLSTEQKLQYVGYQSLARYGCFGCHEIAGFERAKPIGPALTDWGRIDPHRLAFENIVAYLDQPPRVEALAGSGVPDSSDGPAVPDEELSPYYMWQVRAHSRIGFAFQKLTEPRSYDYRVADHKSYNEWLRMHQFPFNAEEREAIVTFVLGLVARTPTDRYVYTPDRRREALIQGRIVLDRYRCGSCHMLEPQEWRLGFPPGTFEGVSGGPTYPFVPHDFSQAALLAAEQPGRDGLLHAALSGMPQLGVDSRPLVFDDYGDPLFEDEPYDPRALEYAFQLWQPAVIDGHGYQVGGPAISVWGDQIDQRRPADGGFLATYLLPYAVEIERRANPGAVGSQAWAWLPPTLLGEGRKVRPNWLYRYLLEPEPIRPASLMRMPKFNFTGGEATALVEYFAVRDRAEIPYDSVPRRGESYLARQDQAYRQRWEQTQDAAAGEGRTRLGDALGIVSNRDYCAACHLIGNFEPAASQRARGPNLAGVYDRLRADYVRRWVAEPSSILPYTPMQVVIPYAPDQDHAGGVPQTLYRGTSVQQLDAVVDLLLNFDVYARRQQNLVAPAQPAAAGPVGEE